MINVPFLLLSPSWLKPPYLPVMAITNGGILLFRVTWPNA